MLTLSYAGLPAMLGNMDPMGLVEYLPDWVPVGWLLFGFVIWFIAQWFARKSLAHKPHKKAVAGWLRHPRYTQLYRWAGRPLVEWFWQRVGDTSVKETEPLYKQAKGALTATLYDKALLFAVAYPIFAAVGYWLWTGNAAAIGSAVILDAAPNPKRLLLLGPFAVLIFLVWLKHHLLASQRKRGLSFADWQNLIILKLEMIGVIFVIIATSSSAASLVGAPTNAFIFVACVALALAVTGAAKGAFIGAFAVTTVFAVLVASTFFVALLIVFVAGVAIVIVIALMGAEEQLPHRIFIPYYYALFMCLLICGFVWYMPWTDDSGEEGGLFVFLGVFPLINGIFDWLSYGVTLSLLRHGLLTARPFAWGAVDLGVACLLFLGLGATLVVVLHGLDQLAGGALVDLPALLGGVYAIKQGDWSQSWALFMVFSTMVPTGLHLLISLIGLQGLWPAPWRRKLAGWIEVDAPSPLAQALLPMVLGVVWAAPIVAGCAVVWALIQWGKPLLGAFFQWYFDVLMWVAQWGGVV